MYTERVTIAYVYDKWIVKNADRNNSILNKLDFDYQVWYSFDGDDVEIRIENKDDIKKFADAYEGDFNSKGIDVLVIHN